MARAQRAGRAVEPVEPVEDVVPVEVDRVAMVSYRADGTPDQTAGHVVLVEDAQV